MSVQLLHGDCRELLPTLPAESVDCCITSPPYFNLRDYGCEGQLGLEETPAAYVENLVAVFAAVHRALKSQGTLWLNLGDSYAREAAKGQHRPGQNGKQAGAYDRGAGRSVGLAGVGLKNKNLLGIPWRVAFALQEWGWILRSEVIWPRGNPMPESVKDRPTRSHEYLFLLAKQEAYYYDHVAVREPFADARMGRDGSRRSSERNRGGRTDGLTKPNGIDPSANGGRNRRSVWNINTRPFPGSHFAVMPAALVAPCVLAGTSAGGVCGQCGTPLQRVVERGEPNREW